MQITSTKTSDTEIQLTVTAEKADLAAFLKRTTDKLGKNVKIPGFRAGTAPSEIVQKSVDQETLMNEFLEIALGSLYAKAAIQEKLKPVSQPNVQVKLFVPFEQLTFTADVPVLGPVKLADYKNLRVKKPADVKITKDEIDEVIKNLQLRMSEKKLVERAAKDTDEVWIDFKGTDKDGKEVKGASGDDYPLRLGSKTFIPGFEEELVGVKAGDEKVFTIVFPKDYGAKHLQSAKVTFAVSVKKVEEVILPKVDDDFAAKVGPFITVTELRENIDLQMSDEKNQSLESEYQNLLVGALVEGSKVEAPQVLVDEQLQGDLAELKRITTQRGLTLDEYAQSLGLMDEAELIEKESKPAAERRVKTGIILSEVSLDLKLEVTDSEVEEYKSELLARYMSDPQMVAQLKSPSSSDALRSQLMSKKPVEKLVELNG
jgi:trigger factor